MRAHEACGIEEGGGEGGLAPAPHAARQFAGAHREYCVCVCVCVCLSRHPPSTSAGTYAAAPKAGSVHHMNSTAAMLMMLSGAKSLPLARYRVMISTAHTHTHTHTHTHQLSCMWLGLAYVHVRVYVLRGEAGRGRS